MLTILNLAVGLSFVYLLFSLAVSALNEIWLSFLDQRTRFLREGIRELFQEYPGTALPGWFESFWSKMTGKSPNDVPAPAANNSSVLTEFYAHGLINSLSRGKNGRPAYIGADMFTTAVLDIVRNKGTGAEAEDAIRTGIEKIKETNAAFAQALNALFQKVDGKVDLFQAEVMNWFNASMDRVSGWYKRYAQQWLLVLSFILAVTCNVDTIHIITTLSTDPKVLQSTVDQAITYAKANPNPPSDSVAAAAEEDLNNLAKKASDALDSLNSASVPVGWSNTRIQEFYGGAGANITLHPSAILSALLGWFLTALAASLGAPFWFDTLNRFINIRGNGRAPDEKPLPAKTGTN